MVCVVFVAMLAVRGVFACLVCLGHCRRSTSTQRSVQWIQRRTEEADPPLSSEGAGAFCRAAVAAAA